MTTIAVSTTHIAADGQGCRSGEIIGLREKKLHIQEGKIFAFLGAAALVEPILSWYQAGADPHKLPPIGSDVRWSALVISSKGLFRFDQASPYADRMHPPLGFGSGADFATGALLAGASARRAVEIACTRDIRSGGEITEIEIAKVIGHSLEGKE